MIAPDPKLILSHLMELDMLENELAVLAHRIERKCEVEKQIESLRAKVPPFVLNHHNRVRSRGRNSTAPVKNWICQSCFISVPMGMHNRLLKREDLIYCENCGATIYVPSEDEEARLTEHKEYIAKLKGENAAIVARQQRAEAEKNAAIAAKATAKKKAERAAKKAAKASTPATKKAAKKAVKKATVKKTVKKAVKKAAVKKPTATKSASKSVKKAAKKSAKKAVKKK